MIQEIDVGETKNQPWCAGSVKQGVPMQKLSKALVDTSTTGSLRMRGYGTP